MSARTGIGWDSHRLVAGPAARSSAACDIEHELRPRRATPTPTSSPTRSSTRCSARPASATSARTSPTPTSASRGADSLALLRQAVTLARPGGLRAASTSTRPSCMERPKLAPAPRRDPRRAWPRRSASPAHVNVKATTGEGMGFVGPGGGRRGAGGRDASRSGGSDGGPRAGPRPARGPRHGRRLLLVLAYRTKLPVPDPARRRRRGARASCPGSRTSSSTPELVLWSSCRRCSTRRRSSRRCATCAPTCGRSACWRSASSTATTVGVAVVAHGSSTGCRGRRRSCSARSSRRPTRSRRPRSPRASGAPRRIVTIVEGESLVNDATALIAYKFAVAAVGHRVASRCRRPCGEFVVDAVGGVAIGIARRLPRRAACGAGIEDAPTEITISLLHAVLRLPARPRRSASRPCSPRSRRASTLGWRSPQLVAPPTRIQAYAVWEVLVFLLNAAALRAGRAAAAGRARRASPTRTPADARALTPRRSARR